MADSMRDSSAVRHVPTPEIRPRMAKADLRKSETGAYTREGIGRAIDRARLHCQLTLKEFAGIVGRDERQIARWITGAERLHLDAILSIDALRGPFLTALSELDHAIDIATVITIRRRA